jgi:hypothetical protein
MKCIHKLICERCGAKWYPRTTCAPRRCARCNSPYWDRPVVRKGTSKAAKLYHAKKTLLLLVVPWWWTAVVTVLA